MTDSEIKKALECCKMPVGSGACNSCPLKAVRDSLRKEDTKSCTTILLENALAELVGMRGACESYRIHYDIAQAEIERLNGISDRLNDICTEQDVEIERLQALVDEMSGYFPTCIGCEGKTTLGERTDECVYLIGNTEYCAKKGIENIGRIMRENRELKEMTEGCENG